MKVAVLGIKKLPAVAGADRVVERLLENASNDLHYTIYLVADGAPRLTCTRERHYVYVPAPRGKHLRAPVYFLLACAHLLLKGGRVNAIHVHNSDFGLFCPLLRLKHNARIVGTFHGDPYLRAKWGKPARLLLRLSEQVFVWSCDTLTSVSGEKTIPGRTLRHIPNGVDVAHHPRPTGHLPIDIEEGFVMFACGRLDRTKGLHHLLEAYRDVSTAKALLVIGDFTHDSSYTAEIQELAGRDSRVVLYPHLLPSEDLYRTLERSSVFVFPSEFEGMSMMLLEAISCRTLVVCSDIAPNIGVVGEGYPYLFRSQDTSALRSALEQALVDAADWDSTALVERVSSRFRWSLIAADYERLYGHEPRHLVASSSPGGDGS